MGNIISGKCISNHFCESPQPFNLEEYFLFNLNIEDETFRTHVNEIIRNFDKLKSDNILYLKKNIYHLLNKISTDYDENNSYLLSIDKFQSKKNDKQSIDKLIELIKKIYAKRKEIGEEEIKLFLKNLEIASEGCDIIDKSSFDYIWEKLNEILLVKEETNDNLPKIEIKQKEDKDVNTSFDEPKKTNVTSSVDNSTSFVKKFFDEIINNPGLLRSQTDNNGQFFGSSVSQIVTIKDKLQNITKEYENEKNNEEGINPKDLKISKINGAFDFNKKMKNYIINHPELINGKNGIKLNGNNIYFNENDFGKTHFISKSNISFKMKE